jgi:integron integrase
MSKLPRLLDAVRKVSRERELSRKTENAYVNHIRRFQDFYAEHDLAQVGEKGITIFMEHLRQTERLAVSTRNQALSALVFLYREVFGQEFSKKLKTVTRVKPTVKKPFVFTPDEARRVLSKMRGDTFLVAALMYGSGLRLPEAVALRVGDIDFERREIIVRRPQTGRRERTTILPETLIPAIERQLANVRYMYEDDLLRGAEIELPSFLEIETPITASVWKRQFVFPSHNLTFGKRTRRFHLAESTVQKAVAEAIFKANILKPACCQTFRYSFAARLFENHYDIRRIQTLLGHKNMKTTVVYMQFARRAGNSVRSPLDN